jgi:hypothetical protein
VERGEWKVESGEWGDKFLKGIAGMGGSFFVSAYLLPQFLF